MIRHWLDYFTAILNARSKKNFLKLKVSKTILLALLHFDQGAIFCAAVSIKNGRQANFRGDRIYVQHTHTVSHSARISHSMSRFLGDSVWLESCSFKSYARAFSKASPVKPFDTSVTEVQLIARSREKMKREDFDLEPDKVFLKLGGEPGWLSR